LDALTCQKYTVLAARPLAAYDVAAMLLWSMIVVPNNESTDTWIR
jgi:hypothetical protein